jgi:hypothetical protein
MAMTHMLLGAALAGSFGPQFIVAGLLGGLLPDFDVFTSQHRKDLHFPFYYAAFGFSALAAGLHSGSGLWFQVAAFAGAASLHCWSDVLGSGIESKPWKGNDDRGVYDHVFDRWRVAQKYVYDGSPADLGIAASASAYLLFIGMWWPIAAGLMSAGVLYTANRKLIGEMMPEESENKIDEVRRMWRNFRNQSSENIKLFFK